MRDLIRVSSKAREELIDVTAHVARVVEQSGLHDGVVMVYVQGATAAILIQENWDDSVQSDVLAV